MHSFLKAVGFSKVTKREEMKEIILDAVAYTHLFVSSHSRKLANAQTDRSVVATSAVLVTESELSSTYQHCYWMFLSRSPIATTDSRTRIDSYLSRAFVSSHSRKLANAQTERSVAATSAVLVTESELSSTYQHCYWMR